MFISEHSNHRDEAGRLKAAKMLDSGLSKEDAFKETGWLIGLEGVWKKEIDVSDLQFSQMFRKYLLVGGVDDFDADKVHVELISPYAVDIHIGNQQQSEKLSNISLLDVEMFLPEDIAKQCKEQFSDSSQPTTFTCGADFYFEGVPNTIPLPLAFENHELFKTDHAFWGTYISSKDDIGIAHAKKGEGNTYEINLDNKTKSFPLDEIKTILVHEAQHVVQRSQGMARGGNSQYFIDIDHNEYMIRKAGSKIKELLQGNPAYAKAEMEATASYLNLVAEYAKPNGEFDWDDVPDEVSDAYFDELDGVHFFDEDEHVFDLNSTQLNALDSTPNVVSSVKQYFMLAGEIESYVAEERTHMSVDERRNNFPNIFKIKSPLVFTTEDALLDYVREQRAVPIESDITPLNETFACFKVSENATFRDIIENASESFLAIYGDLSKTLPDDNQISRDFKVIAEWVGFDPIRWGNMNYQERERHQKKFAQGFIEYMSGGEPKSGAAYIFAELKSWLKRSFRNTNVENLEISEDMKGVYERLMMDKVKINIEPNSFQAKIFNSLGEASTCNTNVKMLMAAMMDTGYKSIAKQSGIEQSKLEAKYSITFKENRSKHRKFQ